MRKKLKSDLQWKDEDSISVVNEKEVVETPENFKEGGNVTVITKNAKGKSTIYIAEVLKIFQSSQPAKKPKTHQKSSQEAQEKKEDKEKKLKEKQLKESVQKERINSILKRSTVQEAPPPPPSKTVMSSNLPSLPHHTSINTHSHKTQNTPLLPTVQTTSSNLPTISQHPLINTHARIQNTPPLPTLKATSHIQAFPQQPFINTDAQMQNTPAPPMATISRSNSPSFLQHSEIQTPLLPTPQTSFPQNTSQFQTYPHSSTPSKFSITVSPKKSQHTISYTEDLMRHDIINLDVYSSELNNSNSESGEWNSFTTHFTSQFEKMKAEIDVLRSEVKSLRRAVKELKQSNPTQTSSNQVEEVMVVANKEDELSKLITNTNKPLDGLKKLLYHLFTEDEVRTSSVKGVTTATGGATSGLNKEYLELIYCLMKKRYEVEPQECDKLIRGQQRKLRENFKKQNS